MAPISMAEDLTRTLLAIEAVDRALVDAGQPHVDHRMPRLGDPSGRVGRARTVDRRGPAVEPCAPASRAGVAGSGVPRRPDDDRPPARLQHAGDPCGRRPDAATGARATPIYQTTSFVFDDVDHAASLFGLQAFGNIYTRITNPTNAVLEERIAALEGGTAALAVASGHAAEFLTMHALMQPGDEFVAARTSSTAARSTSSTTRYKNFGWSVVWADTDDPASFEAAITPRTKAIFCESIANPGRRHHRHRGAVGDRQEAQHPAHRRQHHGDAVPDPALRARRRHRRAFGDQVPRRPRQLDRRPRSSTAARSSGRATRATR